MGRNHNSPLSQNFPGGADSERKSLQAGAIPQFAFKWCFMRGVSLSPISLWRNKVGKKGEGGCEENGCEGRSSHSCKSFSHPKRKYPSGHIGISFVSLLANFTTIMPVQNFLHHPMHHHRRSVRRSDAGGQALLQGVVCLKSGGGGDEGTLQPRWRWWSGHCPTPIWSASSTPSVVSLLDPIGRHKPPHATS